MGSPPAVRSPPGTVSPGAAASPAPSPRLIVDLPAVPVDPDPRHAGHEGEVRLVLALLHVDAEHDEVLAAPDQIEEHTALLAAVRSPDRVEVHGARIDVGLLRGHNRHAGSFFDAALAFAGESGIDVILDPVGGGYLAENLKLLALNGRLVLIGLMGGARAEIDLAQLMVKRARIQGSTLRARPRQEKAEIMGQLEQKVWPRIEAGEIKPIVDSIFPIQEAEAAHGLVASDKTIGKVVMEIAN